MSLSEQELTLKLNAIADPARRKILTALKERGKNSIGKEVGLCASDIESRMQLSQPTISHHLKILADADVIVVREAGQHRIISVNLDLLHEIADVLPIRGDSTPARKKRRA